MFAHGGPRRPDPGVEKGGFEPFHPACWQGAVDTVVTALAEGAPAILVLAPPGYGKTTFLGQLGARVAAAGRPEEVVTVAPEATGEWLAPMLAALALSDPPLIAVDAAERMTDAALRDLLLLATAPARAGRPASVVLAGEPELTKRIERLLPARQARSLPRAMLPAWSQDDVLAYLRARATASGGQLLHVDAGAAARLVEITKGRPIAICNLVGGVAGPGTVTAGETLPPWETRLADEPVVRPIAAAAVARLRSIEGGGANGDAMKDVAAARRDGAPGLSDAALPPLAPPHSLTGTTVGVIGIGGGSRPRSTASRLARLVPMVLVVLAVAVAGWALWSERLSHVADDGRFRGPRMAAALSAKDPLQETVLARTDAAEPAPAAAAATAPAGVAAEPAKPSAETSPPAEAAPAPAAPPRAEPSPPPAAAIAAEPAKSAAETSPRSEPSPPPPAAASPQPAPTAADKPAAKAPTSGETAELIARGDALLRLADLSAARQFYLLAARRGAASGLTAAAGTYDPVYLRSVGIPAGAGNPRRAIELYREAVGKGDSTAAARLRALIDAQREAGAIDAAEARRLSEP